MPKKYLKLLFLFAVIVFLLSAFHPASALEVTYPNFSQNGGGSPVNSNSLVDFIKYFFTFSIAAAGVLGILTIIISGFQILISGGSPTAIGDAKERIVGAALGIVLLFASVIIINTINPTLASPSLSGLPQQPQQGVLLNTIYNTTVTGFPYPPVGDAITTISAPQSRSCIISNAPAGTPASCVVAQDKIIPNPLNNPIFPQGDITLDGKKASLSITYVCPAWPGPNVLLWVYNKIDFQLDRLANGNDDVKTYSLPCKKMGEVPATVTLPATVKSYKWAYEQPGVYFYKTNNCSGISLNVQTENGRVAQFDNEPRADSLGGNLNQTPQSMRIVNGQTQQYGVILNELEGATGECSYPILNTQVPTGNDFTKDVCEPIPNVANGNQGDPRFAYVFRTAEPRNNWSFRFESNSMFVNANEDGGFVDRIWSLPGAYGGDLNKWFDNVRGDVTDQSHWLTRDVEPIANECADPWPPCLSFTRSNGNFRLILYTWDQFNEADHICQVYTDQENNFSDATPNRKRWVFNGGRTFYDVMIIPMPNAAAASGSGP